MHDCGGPPATIEDVVTVEAPVKSAGRPFSLRNLLVRNHWMLADQALVSGMNFLTTAMLARMLGVHNFGIFSIYYIVLQYLTTISLALNVSPLMSLAPQLQDPAEHRSFLRGMAGYQYILSLGCCVGAALYFLVEKLHLSPWRTEAGVALPFILTVFSFQAQDWFRRFCYVQERGRTVFWNDVLSYLGQIAVFCLLWWWRSMNVNSAYYAIAVTSLAAFSIGFVTSDIGSTWHEIKSAIARTSHMGRSMLVSGQLMWLGSQGIFLIVAAEAGVSAASGIRAAIALMGPVNVLYQLLDNVLPVRAARAYAAGGEQRLASYLQRAGAILGVLVGVPILLVTVFARPIMMLVFGRSYMEFAPLVAWQGLYMWLLLIYKELVYYHRTVEMTTVLARSAMAVAAVSVTACLLLTRRYGAVGGMVALDAGQALSVAILLMSALRKHRRARTDSWAQGAGRMAR